MSLGRIFLCLLLLLTLVHAGHGAVGDPFHEPLPRQPAPPQPREQPHREVLLLGPYSIALIFISLFFSPFFEIA